MAYRARLLAGAAGIGVLLIAGLAAAPASAQREAQQRAEWAPAMGIDDYAWIDRADTLTETIGEAPPDHGFVYADGEPWAWQLDDGSVVITEQRPDGLHSYYFDPGYDAPFLVRDRDISYAFVHGQVAVIYGPDGELVAREQGDVWLDDAAYAYRRGEALYRAWKRRDDRPVVASAWIDFSWIFYDWNRHWSEGRQRHWRWKRWRERHDVRDRDWRRRLEEERRRRELLADRFRQWREHRFEGAPPGKWQRPGAGWQPRPPGTRPDRPGRPGRGEGMQRPRPERADGTPAPRPPRRAEGDRGGVRRPDRAGHPPAPVATPAAEAPAPAPAPRPRWSDRSGETRARPERPASTPRPPRPSAAPVPRTERPTYTPPVRTAAPPPPPPPRSSTPAPTPPPAARTSTPTPAPPPKPSSSGRSWGRETKQPN